MLRVTPVHVWYLKQVHFPHTVTWHAQHIFTPAYTAWQRKNLTDHKEGNLKWQTSGCQLPVVCQRDKTKGSESRTRIGSPSSYGRAGLNRLYDLKTNNINAGPATGSRKRRVLVSSEAENRVQGQYMYRAECCLIEPGRLGSNPRGGSCLAGSMLCCASGRP